MAKVIKQCSRMCNVHVIETKYVIKEAYDDKYREKNQVNE